MERAAHLTPPTRRRRHRRRRRAAARQLPGGVTAELAAARETWSGTLLAVFQPAEEPGAGALAMIDDGLFDRFARPDVVLGQHVAPLPACMLALRPGPAFAGNDTVRITLHGSGGHGSRPETTVDPVVLAAVAVLRLQTIVSREIAGTETAVLTVGTMRAGGKENIIPDRAELGLSVRTYDAGIREKILAAIERIAAAEAAASGATTPPEVRVVESFPPTVNDVAGAERTRPALAEVAPVVEPGLVTGSEDVGLFATESGAPCVYWILGGADPAAFAGATSRRNCSCGWPPSRPTTRRSTPRSSSHVVRRVAALVAAARRWLPAGPLAVSGASPNSRLAVMRTETRRAGVSGRAAVPWRRRRGGSGPRASRRSR